jgi:2-oxoglutarate/2-oxoacid ferredoxin oxidoreductase subunit beta
MDQTQPPYLDERLRDVDERGHLDYRSHELPTWCPGCGYFGITQALIETCRDLALANDHIGMVSGIGCAGRTPIFFGVYGFHVVHGRSVPVATGLKLARPELTVFAVAGDGDALGIGGGHLPHAARRNVDITLFLFDNGIYGLTKGQTSPTTPTAQITSTHPFGNPDTPLNPIELALAYGASFVAQGFAGEVASLKDIFTKAINHKGFSFVHIISPCVTFDKDNITWNRLRGQCVAPPPNHDTSGINDALRLAQDPRLIIGVFYHDPARPDYQTRLAQIAAERAAKK